MNVVSTGVVRRRRGPLVVLLVAMVLANMAASPRLVEAVPATTTTTTTTTTATTASTPQKRHPQDHTWIKLGGLAGRRHRRRPSLRSFHAPSNQAHHLAVHTTTVNSGLPAWKQDLYHRAKVGGYFALWYALNIVYNSTFAASCSIFC